MSFGRTDDTTQQIKLQKCGTSQRSGPTNFQPGQGKRVSAKDRSGAVVVVEGAGYAARAEQDSFLRTERAVGVLR